MESFISFNQIPFPMFISEGNCNLFTKHLSGLSTLNTWPAVIPIKSFICVLHSLMVHTINKG